MPPLQRQVAGVSAPPTTTRPKGDDSVTTTLNAADPDDRCQTCSARATSCDIRRWLGGRPCCDTCAGPHTHLGEGVVRADLVHLEHHDLGVVHDQVSDQVNRDQVSDQVSDETNATYVIEHGNQQLALPLALRPDRCDHCPSSREGCEGCEARQAFAKGERCCRRCTHDPADNECPPNNTSMRHFLGGINQ